MNKKVNILIWTLTLSFLAFGQNFVEKDTIHILPDKIVELTNEEVIILSESIHFSGGNKQDYIITTKLDNNGHKVCEYWITSDLIKVRQVEIFKDGIQIRKFINLDTDPELEIIDATGYEDGIDYTIQDLDIITGELKKVLYFNPIIETKIKDYWGYPWDWTKLKLNSNFQLKVSLKHKIERNGNITFPKNQKIMPVIYFEGNPTQESSVEGIKSINWLTLNEIIEKSR